MFLDSSIYSGLGREREGNTINGGHVNEIHLNGSMGVSKNVFGHEFEHSSCNQWFNHVNHSFNAHVDPLTHLNKSKK